MAESDSPSSLGDLVGGYVAEQCRVILDAEAHFRAGENVIHSTRVAVRRLRSTVRVFGELFDVPRAGHLEDELVWWGGLLGDVRDADILADRLATMVAELPAELTLGPVGSTIQAALATQRSEAMSAVLDALDSARYRNFTAVVARWLADPPLTAAAATSPGAVGRYVTSADKKLRKRLATAVAAGRGGEPDHHLLHQARKAGKRHRYAAELATPVWGDKAERIVNRRKALQDLLGDHQDSIVSSEFLRGLAARVGVLPGQNGFSYGVLYAREAAADASLLERLKSFL